MVQVRSSELVEAAFMGRGLGQVGQHPHRNAGQRHPDRAHVRTGDRATRRDSFPFRRKLMNDAEWQRIAQMTNPTFPQPGMSRCAMMATSHYRIRQIKNFESPQGQIEIWKSDLSESIFFGLDTGGHALFTLVNGVVATIACRPSDPKHAHPDCLRWLPSASKPKAHDP